jgi:hypothetical protein|tara:strand:+ start:1477 stop:1989 length:513 start_codon:yes stop_codon:yes gene_type:complete
MYNKYSSMKKSELKEAIKNEITSVLSEQSNNPDFDKKVASFAKKINNEMDYPGGVLEAMKQIKSRLERIISKVEGAKRGGAEEEPLMKMVGLSEAKSAADVDKEVKDLKAKMIEKAKEFKKAEGKAKDKIKDELKAMTVKKGDLEKKVEDLKSKEEEKIANKGKDQELDA